MSKAKSIKALASDSVIYGLSGVISRFIGVFLTPLYTRVYSPDDYGIMGVLNNGYTLVTLVLVLALDNSTARWFYDTNDKYDRRKSISTWVWFYLMFSIVAAVTLFSLSKQLSSLLFNGVGEGYVYIRILALTLPVMLWMGVANNVLRFERKVIPTVSLTLIYSLTLVGLNILFVLVFRWGLMGAFYAQLASGCVAMIVSVYLIKDWLGSFKLFDMQRLLAMIKYSLPFVPASIAYWLVNLSGVFFVNAYMSGAEAGLYQIGVSIAAVAGLATNAFQQAWSPFAFSIINNDNAKEVYAKVFYVYTLLVGTFCMLIALFTPEALVILTTPEYYDAGWVASILAFSYLAMGLTSIADIGTAIAKKTAPLGMISVVSAIVLVSLNLWLIPLFGKEGAACSILLSQFIVPVYMFYISQKVYPIPYEFKKITVIGLFIISASILGRLIHTGHFVYDIGLKMIILIVVALFFYYTNTPQITYILQTIKKRKERDEA